MKNRILLLIMTFFFAASAAYSYTAVTNVFNLPTYQTSGDNVLIFEVGHRYLDVNRHTTNIDLSLSYGLFSFIDVFAAYTFKNKDMLGGLKINILDDYTPDKHFISLSLVGAGGYKDTNQVNNAVSTSYADDSKIKSVSTLEKKDRTSFFGQAVIQVHLFSNRLSIGAVPTYAYNTNFYGIESKKDNSAGCGFSSEIYFLDRVAVCGEVVPNFYGFAFKYMTYTAGLKYAGYRHTFGLWMSNCAGYSPVEYIAGNITNNPKICFNFTREFDTF